jgi:hypothetical protein
MVRVHSEPPIIRVIKVTITKDNINIDKQDVIINKKFSSYYVVEPIRILGYRTKLFTKDEKCPSNIKINNYCAEGYIYFKLPHIGSNSVQSSKVEREFLRVLINKLKLELSENMAIMSKYSYFCNTILEEE